MFACLAAVDPLLAPASPPCSASSHFTFRIANGLLRVTGAWVVFLTSYTGSAKTSLTKRKHAVSICVAPTIMMWSAQLALFVHCGTTRSQMLLQI